MKKESYVAYYLVNFWSYQISTVLDLQFEVLTDLYGPISPIFGPTRSLPSHLSNFWSYQISSVLSLQSLVLLDLYRPISPISCPAISLPSFFLQSLVLLDLYRTISTIFCSTRSLPPYLCNLWSYQISTVLSIQSLVLADLCRSNSSNLWPYQISTVLSPPIFGPILSDFIPSYLFNLWCYQFSTFLSILSLVLHLYRPTRLPSFCTHVVVYTPFNCFTQFCNRYRADQPCKIDLYGFLS